MAPSPMFFQYIITNQLLQQLIRLIRCQAAKLNGFLTSNTPVLFHVILDQLLVLQAIKTGLARVFGLLAQQTVQISR